MRMKTMKEWLNEHIQKLWKFLEADAELRRKNQEVNKYNKKWIVYPLGLLLFVSLFILARNLTVTQTIPKILAEHPEDFFLVKEGGVYFKDASKKTKITLPMRNLSVLPGFDVKNIWYEFDVVLPEKFRSRTDLGMMVSAIWGRYKVYIDNQLVDYGRDDMNVIPVTQHAFKLFVQVDGEGLPKYGIRGTFPVVIGNISQVRGFINIFNEQAFVYVKALVAQLVALFLFLVLFINLPNKPELFVFLAVFITNIVFYFTYTGYVENINQIFKSSVIYTTLLASLSLLRSFLLYYFILEFFRFSKNLARAWTAKFLGVGLLVIPCLMFIVLHKISYTDYFSAFQIVQETYFLILCVVIGLVKILYLRNHLGHNMRAILGLLIVVAIAYNGVMNIYDYFFIHNKVTTEYLNHIYTYFAVAVVTMVEFSRTEKDRNQLTKNLSKEVQEKVLQKFGKFEKEHSGLIVLVDMVGFTQTQKKVGSENQKVFIEGLLKHLMKHFNTGSKLAGTGDGFYFSWKEKYSLDAVIDKLEMIYSLMSDEITLQDLGVVGVENQAVKFRCSLGYGSYVTGIVEEGKLSTDYTSGVVLSELSRVIGAGDKKTTLRILLSDVTRGLLNQFRKEETQIQAKNFETYSYLELDQSEIKFFTRKEVA